MRALFKNRAGDELVLTDVKFDGRLVTGTTRHGRRVALRCNDLERQKVLTDQPGGRR